MGHGNDVIFQKSYLSQHSNVNIQNIYNGRGTRVSSDDVRCLRMEQDRAVPLKLPRSLLDQIEKDQSIQSWKQERSELKEQLQEVKSNGDRITQTSIEDKIIELNRKLNARRILLKKRALKDFRTKWFKNRPSEIITASVEHNNIDLLVEETDGPLDIRRGIVEALYSKKLSRVEILDEFLKYYGVHIS